MSALIRFLGTIMKNTNNKNFFKETTIGDKDGFLFHKNNQSIFVTQETQHHMRKEDELMNVVYIKTKYGQEYRVKCFDSYSKVDDILFALYSFQKTRERNEELQSVFENIKEQKRIKLGNKVESANPDNPVFEGMQKAPEKFSKSFGAFPIKGKKVKSLPLSNRPKNALIRSGITQSDYIPTTMKALKNIKGMGTKSAKEILQLKEKHQ